MDTGAERQSFVCAHVRPFVPPIALIVAVVAGATPALAAGTAAGTVIDNSARVSYDIGGTALSIDSNVASITVDERVDVVVTLQSPQVLVAPGDSNRGLLFRVTNTGNGAEDFLLAIDSVLAGDDFDPVPAVPAMYFDTDASGDFSVGDTPYAPGSNDPQLAADAFTDILLVNDIPLAATNGETGLSQLTATATTGSGTPGDVFAGLGDGGTDAVIGTTGARAAVSGEYFVSDVAVSIGKTVSVADPFGGTQPVPGATLTYTINVQVTNVGTASNSVVNDPIPANTTYVPSSITLNAAALSDAVDVDAGELELGGVPAVVVRLGDLTQAAGVQTVTFQVTID